LTQPAISKTVAELEAKLGIRLLDRTARGVAPTAEGKVLLARALNIFAELRHAAEELQSLADASAGTLRIACAPILVGGFLPAVLNRLMHDKPGVRYDVREVEPDAALRALRERLADILVGRPLSGNPTDIEFEPLFEEKLFIVAGANHPLARRRSVLADDLRKQRWILPQPETAIGRLVEPALAKLGVPTRDAAVRSMSVLLRFPLLATGEFVTALPGSVLFLGNAQRALRALRALRIELLQTAGPVGLMSMRGISLPPVARLFGEYARQVAKRLQGLQSQRST